MTIQTDAWFPENATIKLENNRTGSIYTITTKVTNFSDGGGDKTTESIPHFGNAFLVIRKPQEDFEVEFEVDITDTSWMQYISGDVVEAGAGSFKMVRSGGVQDQFKIKVEWKSPTNNEAYKIVYYNAYGVTLEKDNAADDRLTGTMSFAISPTDSNANKQRLEFETTDRTSTGIGSTITGSYGSWEAYYDSVFGYTVGGML